MPPVTHSLSPVIEKLFLEGRSDGFTGSKGLGILGPPALGDLIVLVALKRKKLPRHRDGAGLSRFQHHQPESAVFFAPDYKGLIKHQLTTVQTPIWPCGTRYSEGPCLAFLPTVQCTYGQQQSGRQLPPCPQVPGVLTVYPAASRASPWTLRTLSDTGHTVRSTYVPWCRVGKMSGRLFFFFDILP